MQVPGRRYRPGLDTYSTIMGEEAVWNTQLSTTELCNLKGVEVISPHAVHRSEKVWVNLRQPPLCLPCLFKVFTCIFRIDMQVRTQPWVC